MARVALLLLASSLAASTANCVSTTRYDRAVADATACAAKARDIERQRAELSAQLDAATRASAARDKALHASLDDAQALNERLRAEIAHLGESIEALRVKEGASDESLADARAHLAELRKAQAAAEARAALYADLVHKLQKVVDTGDLQIVLRDGRMVLRLPNDVLFDSGRKDLKARGVVAIESVARVLATMKGRHFQVAGHTDDQPIRSSPYASNWELSTERALEVVSVLVREGVRPEMLSAAGYGEFDPVGPNDTEASRARNRRIEITLVPQIDELVTVPSG